MAIKLANLAMERVLPESYKRCQQCFEWKANSFDIVIRYPVGQPPLCLCIDCIIEITEGAAELVEKRRG